MNEVFDFLNGKPYVLDGVAGKFKHEISWAIYPTSHRVERLTHIPNSTGKRSKSYMVIRRHLKDDWVSDLTDDIDRYCKIAKELGLLD